MSASNTDPSRPPMPRGLPKNLLAFFTQALESYKLSQTPFRVLCSLTPSSSHDELAPPPPAPPPPASQPRFLLVLDSSFNPPTLAHMRMALSAAAAASSRVLLLLATSNADKAPKPAAFPQRLAMMYIFAQDLLSATARGSSSQDSDGDGDGAAAPAVDIAVTTEPYFHSKSKAVAESDFYRGRGRGRGSSVESSLETETKTETETGAAAFEQVYLTGFDTLIRIFNPKYYPDGTMAASLDPFFARARLRVTMRTDAEWGDAEAQREYLEGLRDGGLAGVGGRTEWAEKVEMVVGRQEGEAVVSSTKVRDAVVGKDWDLLRTLVSERMIEWIRREELYSWDDR